MDSIQLQFTENGFVYHLYIPIHLINEWIVHLESDKHKEPYSKKYMSKGRSKWNTNWRLLNERKCILLSKLQKTMMEFV